MMKREDQATNERQQPKADNDQKRRDEDQLWANWWREYAQTWQ
jgi:hypothetical protein